MPGQCSWQITATQATLICGPLRGAVDLLSPATGLGQVSYDGVPLAGSQFLGIDIEVGDPATLVDFYQRGRDLVVRYAQTGERPFAVMVYWCTGLLAIGGTDHPHVDLIVSVETNLLDSRPMLAAKSFFAVADEDSMSCQPGFFVARFHNPAITYGELCHPEDALAASAEAARGGVELTTRLFGLPLEKGVILRSRLRGLFVPRQHDEELARSALADFAAAPPPLTT